MDFIFQKNPTMANFRFLRTHFFLVHPVFSRNTTHHNPHTHIIYMSCKYLTVIASVGAADVGRIAPTLASGRHVVSASSSSSTTGGETGEGLEIQPQLANIIIHFAKSKCTGPRSCRSVGASITRILDVGSIC